MACQSTLLNPSFLIGPRHLIWAWHALPRAVPQSGQRLEDKNCKDCGATRRCRQYGLADCMHTAESSVRTQNRR